MDAVEGLVLAAPPSQTSQGPGPRDKVVQNRPDLQMLGHAARPCFNWFE